MAQRRHHYRGRVVPKTRIFILVLAIVAVTHPARGAQDHPLGRRIRAVVQNRGLAETSGISTARSTDISTFFIGSGLAGVAGVALTLIGSTGPTIGHSYLIDAFLVVVVGGLGQIKGAVIAAFALGLLTRSSSTPPRVAREGDRVRAIVVFLQVGPRACSPCGRGAWHDATLTQRLRAVPRNCCRSGGFALAAVLLFARAPGGPARDFRLNLLAKFLCFAIVAVGIGLAWGRGGMLALGQGVFFGLGGYVMAMHLKLADAARPGNACPTSWRSRHRRSCRSGSRSAARCRAARHPGAARGWSPSLLGSLVFKRRVRAPTSPSCPRRWPRRFAILLIGQQGPTGGTNGLSDFRASSASTSDPANQQMLYFIVVVASGRLAARPPAGAQPLRRTAGGGARRRGAGPLPRLRPGQHQDRRLCGGGVHGRHRRCAVRPIVGIISPAPTRHRPLHRASSSVSAIGGRATLLGRGARRDRRRLGADHVLGAFPSGWIYLQGLLFIVVVGFLPAGLAGLFRVAALADARDEAAARTGRPTGRRSRTAACTAMTGTEPRVGGNAGMASQYSRSATSG